ncbi:MAG TPA: hypothetical protein VF661_11950 [Actinomycetales bacterium]|jgi:uncharacterized membrane protein
MALAEIRASSPLVDAYLSELADALSEANPRDRADIIAGIEEHLEHSLSKDRDPAHVRQVLDALGPADRIAAEAGIEAPAREATVPASWLASTGLVVAALSVVLLAVNPFAAVPAALVAVVLCLISLRVEPQHRRRAGAGLGVAAVPIVFALVVMSFLMSIRGTSEVVPARSDPVTTASATATLP